MTCVRPGCDQALTQKQVWTGTRFCSRTCMGLARRHPTDGPRPTHCRVCATPLTWAQARAGEHCSIRCAMRTRHGRPAHDRTTCAACDGPLSRRQRWRRRTFCSKSCAKTTEHQQRPEVLAKGQAVLRTWTRAQFVGRLRAFLLACPSREAAGRRGWKNGWGAARRQAIADGCRRGHGTHTRAHRAEVVRVSAAAPSKAEAYRRCYAAAWAAAWRVYRARARAA